MNKSQLLFPLIYFAGQAVRKQVSIVGASTRRSHFDSGQVIKIQIKICVWLWLSAAKPIM